MSPEGFLARRASVVAILVARWRNNVLDIGRCHGARRRRVLDGTRPHSRTGVFCGNADVGDDYGLVSVNLIRDWTSNKWASFVHGEQ